MCFDQLHAAGCSRRWWLLIDIQSPSAAASQPLDAADTWRHGEALCAAVRASFLFWQQAADVHASAYAT